MVLMAQQFKRAGYDVCVCGSSEFSQMARDFDVPFEPYPHNYSKIYLENQQSATSTTSARISGIRRCCFRASTNCFRRSPPTTT